MIGLVIMLLWAGLLLWHAHINKQYKLQGYILSIMMLMDKFWGK